MQLLTLDRRNRDAICAANRLLAPSPGYCQACRRNHIPTCACLMYPAVLLHEKHLRYLIGYTRHHSNYCFRQVAYSSSFTARYYA